MSEHGAASPDWHALTDRSCFSLHPASPGTMMARSANTMVFIEHLPAGNDEATADARRMQSSDNGDRPTLRPG